MASRTPSNPPSDNADARPEGAAVERRTAPIAKRTTLPYMDGFDEETAALHPVSLQTVMAALRADEGEEQSSASADEDSDENAPKPPRRSGVRGTYSFVHGVDEPKLG